MSSPSGGGKTTVIKKMVEEKNNDYAYSISMTTRPIREGEIDGRDYLFVGHAEFEDMIEAGRFIEYERVHDWYYGTPKASILQWLGQGKTVLLDLDVMGALRLKKKFGKKALLIFLKPPSEEILRRRLEERSTETPRQIARRLERVAAEMAKADEFDVIIVNEDLEKTIRQVKKEIQQKRMFSHMEV